MQAAQKVSDGALTVFGLSSPRGNHCWWRHHHRNKHLNGDNTASVIVISICETSRHAHNLQLVSAFSLSLCASELVIREKEKTNWHGVTVLSHICLSWLEFVSIWLLHLLIPFTLLLVTPFVFTYVIYAPSHIWNIIAILKVWVQFLVYDPLYITDHVIV